MRISWRHRRHRRTNGRNIFQLSTGFTWSSAVTLMILSGVNEHKLCPSPRLHFSHFSCCGYKLKALVTRTLASAETAELAQGTCRASHALLKSASSFRLKARYLCVCFHPATHSYSLLVSQRRYIQNSQSACVAAKVHPEFTWMRATQFSSGQWVNKARGNSLLRADTCIKGRTSSYTNWGPIQRRGLSAEICVEWWKFREQLGNYWILR
jgi:hypothetical protein